MKSVTAIQLDESFSFMEMLRGLASALANMYRFAVRHPVYTVAATTSVVALAARANSYDSIKSALSTNTADVDCVIVRHFVKSYTDLAAAQMGSLDKEKAEHEQLLLEADKALALDGTSTAAFTYRVETDRNLKSIAQKMNYINAQLAAKMKNLDDYNCLPPTFKH